MDQVAITREQLEKHQVWAYLVAAGTGLTLGIHLQPEVHDAILYVPLGVLLYATFVQVPMARLPAALKDRRYLVATILVNFIFVPAAVWSLAWLAPREPTILPGIFMVLLVPCTDWFIVFSHLGKGDVKLALASTPLLLFGQFLILPFYLWLFLSETLGEVIRLAPFVQVFFLLIVLPLMLAAATEFLAGRRPAVQRSISFMSWAPVTCLAVVLFLIAFAEGSAALNVFAGLGRVALVFVLYLAAAAGIGLLTARLLGLPEKAGRTLIFSAGTGNSFVVLPFSLALPAGWEAAVAVVVLQPLVELLGLLVYLRVVPRLKVT